MYRLQNGISKASLNVSVRLIFLNTSIITNLKISRYLQIF